METIKSINKIKVDSLLLTYKKMSIFQIIKGLVTSKQFTRFLWTTLDAFLAYLVVYFTQINLLWILPIVSGFQLLTKELMNRVNPKS